MDGQACPLVGGLKLRYIPHKEGARDGQTGLSSSKRPQAEIHPPRRSKVGTNIPPITAIIEEDNGWGVPIKEKETRGERISSENASTNAHTTSNDASFTSPNTDQMPHPDSNFFIPPCPTECKPRVGMVFQKLEDGILFYKEYAALAGFDIRMSTTTTSSDGVKVWKYILCSREGHKHFAPGAKLAHKQVEASQNGRKTKRRRIFNRTGCRARVIFSLCGTSGYTITLFEERHNHLMLSIMSRPFLKINRNIDIGHKKFMLNCAKANIGTMKSFRLFKESVGSYNNIGATSIDFKNFKRDLKAYVAGGDAQMIIDKLFRRQETCPAFRFAYDVDESDQLIRLFWCDPVARKNWAMFGDVLSFDATYETNRYNMVFTPFTGVDNHQKCVTFGAGLLRTEDIEYYTWVFRQFQDAMDHDPKCIITDQDPSLHTAVSEVFPHTTHRYCMWHITKKLGGKVGEPLNKDTNFMTRFNEVVWSHYLDSVEFENQWHEVMNDYDLVSHKWFIKLFEIRTSWIPAYFRDLFMAGLLRTTSRSESENSFFGEFSNQNFSLVEFFMQFESAMDAKRHRNALLNAETESCTPVFKTPLAIERHAASIYTLTVFYNVQKEICAACFSCSVVHVDDVEDKVQYTIKDMRGMLFIVMYSSDTGCASCSCKHYQRIGLLCRHIFVVLQAMGCHNIPELYVSKRWCKNDIVYRSVGTTTANYEKDYIRENTKWSINKLWSDIHACVALVEHDSDLLGSFSEVIRAQKTKLQGLSVSDELQGTKNKMFESFYGIASPSEVRVLPPEKVHNKGSGKRIKSAKELAIEQSKKHKRLCRTCNQTGFHDSRNCPLNKSTS
ncbi:unnamed protein product [Cuscuta campestris]|uniref:SWIM-type domain-containing protein n=1 Tax=Cuscuta campestris TaxID=132261 RepID=A0A484LBC4_9ASTE|nr:unnamed protein product [Cuscuta campestris]